ncbi:hypothetical protein D3C76_886840 [compost metagenome]
MHQITARQALRLPGCNRTLTAHVRLPVPEQRIGLPGGLTLDADDRSQLLRLTRCTATRLALLDRVWRTDDQHYRPRQVAAQAFKGLLELGLVQIEVKRVVERLVGAVGKDHQVRAQRLEGVLPAGLPFVRYLKPRAVDAQRRVDHPGILLPLQVPATQYGARATVEGQIQRQAEIVHHRAEAPLPTRGCQQPAVLATGVTQQQRSTFLRLVQG